MSSPRFWFLAALAALATSSPVAPALTINLTYDTNGQAGSVPSGDSDGSELMRICQAAADYWEDIIEDSHTLNLQVRYDNSISGIGKWTESSESGGRPTAGAISFKGTTPWYYDPTPNNHSEYDLAETLVRDLTTTTFNSTYSGSPPTGSRILLHRHPGRRSASRRHQHHRPLLRGPPRDLPRPRDEHPTLDLRDRGERHGL